MEFEENEEGEEDMGIPAAGRSGGGGEERKVSGRYRECLKNHAVTIGGHAVDGCGEFMAAGEEGTLDALRCAACSCHRNFHRKESDALVAAPGGYLHPHQHHHQQFSPYYRTPAGYLHQHVGGAAQVRAPPPALALPSTSGEGEEGGSDPAGSGSGRKRFRTKFTQEQKEKMLAFAERVGWRIQKHDEAAVQQFCQEASVKRHVLKVWMHNNKHTLGKKPPDPILVPPPPHHHHQHNPN